MNILLITWNYPPKVGGIENMLSQLVSQWQQTVTVTVIGPLGDKQSYGDDVIRPKKDGVFRFFLSALYNSLKLLRTEKYDVIVTGSALITPLAVLLGSAFNLPVATLIHGLDILYPHPAYQWIMKHFLPRCDFIFSNSGHTKQLAIDVGVSYSRIEVINPGLDFTEFTSVQAPSDFLDSLNIQNRKIILSAGRLAARKGIPEFIEHVIFHLVQEHPEIMFVIVGDNPVQSLAHKEDIKCRIIDTVEKFNLSDNVLALGHVNRNELVELYSVADIFVLPAITKPNDVEGFGIVLLEAGAAGCPTVSTRLGGIPDAVADGKTGILVDPDDWQAMTTAIIHLLNNDSLRKSLGNNGRDRVKNYFDWPISKLTDNKTKQTI